MNKPSKQYSKFGAFDVLLKDPIIVRVISVVDLASLSVLELLEFDVPHEYINYALAKEVIAFDNSAAHHPEREAASFSPSKGDYYFSYLNSKVKLTDLGVYLLEIVKAGASEQEQLTFPPRAETSKEIKRLIKPGQAPTLSAVRSTK